MVDGVVGMEPRRDSMKGRAMREPALRRNRRRVEFMGFKRDNGKRLQCLAAD